MVNEVARNISKDLPELLIYTLAYADTQKPPTITKPEDNVSPSVWSSLAAQNAPASAVLQLAGSDLKLISILILRCLL